MTILYFFWHQGLTFLHKKFQVILSKIKDGTVVFVIEQKNFFTHLKFHSQFRGIQRQNLTMTILYFFWHQGLTFLHKKFQVILSKIKDVAAIFVNQWNWPLNWFCTVYTLCRRRRRGMVSQSVTHCHTVTKKNMKNMSRTKV